MPKNGYWIECIPLAGEAAINDVREGAPHLYAATMASIPQVKAVAETPEQAIDRLRHKLRALGRYYRMLGKKLPETDNPVRPPRHPGADRGWISVYIKYTDECSNDLSAGH